MLRTLKIGTPLHTQAHTHAHTHRHALTVSWWYNVASVLLLRSSPLLSHTYTQPRSRTGAQSTMSSAASSSEVLSSTPASRGTSEKTDSHATTTTMSPSFTCLCVCLCLCLSSLCVCVCVCVCLFVCARIFVVFVLVVIDVCVCVGVCVCVRGSFVRVCACV